MVKNTLENAIHLLSMKNIKVKVKSVKFSRVASATQSCRYALVRTRKQI